MTYTYHNHTYNNYPCTDCKHYATAYLSLPLNITFAVCTYIYKNTKKKHAPHGFVLIDNPSASQSCSRFELSEYITQPQPKTKKRKLMIL